MNAREDEEDDDDDGWKIAACCLCHCGLDYSDRAAFFKADREEDYSEHGNDDANDKDDANSRSSYFFRPNDPYLPESIYDKHNALVYCDGCDRMFHQKCHFVPLTVLPRGTWVCLLCQSLQQMPDGQNKIISKPARKSKKTKELSIKPIKQSKEEAEQVEKERQQCLSLVPHMSVMFVSPPVESARKWEVQWEYLVRNLKADLWQTELSTRLKQAVSSQATTYRLAETAAVTLTSTQRNRSMHIQQSKGIISQELAQTLVKLYGSRLQWRELCFNLDRIRRSTNDSWHALQVFVREYYQNAVQPNSNQKQLPSPSSLTSNDFAKRVIFPFGSEHRRRIEPRTAEMKKALLEQNKKESIPEEIFVLATSEKEEGNNGKRKDDNDVDKKKQVKASSMQKEFAKGRTDHPDNKKGRAKGGVGDDTDSGVTLDNLHCCVCHTDHATDENDLVMCDGTGCYRAYHMKCLKPELTLADLENEDSPDWFCPLCMALSRTLLSIQIEYKGEEWEEERYNIQQQEQRNHKTAGAAAAAATDDDSHKSWDNPDEVFPTAAQDYAAACQMKQGLRNKATDDLLARILGVDQLSDHDSDDEAEDEHFDLDSFMRQRQQRRQRKERRERHSEGDDDDDDDDDDENDDDDDDDDDESSHSSQATLVEMSSVELEIGKGELDALSKASSADGDDDTDNGAGKRRQIRLRRSRRLGSAHRKNLSPLPSEEGAGNNANIPHKDNPKTVVANLGEFDESNIVHGKRGRKPVDYIQLNEAIFGDVSEQEAARYLDDADEHDCNDHGDDDDGSGGLSDTGSECNNDQDKDDDSKENKKKPKISRKGKRNDEQQETSKISKASMLKRNTTKKTKSDKAQSTTETRRKKTKKNNGGRQTTKTSNAEKNGEVGADTNHKKPKATSASKGKKGQTSSSSVSNPQTPNSQKSRKARNGTAAKPTATTPALTESSSKKRKRGSVASPPHQGKNDESTTSKTTIPKASPNTRTARSKKKAKATAKGS
ncbi:hypothetical protein ACA910_018230 [Epithemia clementina (nom. ined.)]